MSRYETSVDDNYKKTIEKIEKNPIYFDVKLKKLVNFPEEWGKFLDLQNIPEIILTENLDLLIGWYKYIQKNPFPTHYLHLIPGDENLENDSLDNNKNNDDVTDCLEVVAREHNYETRINKYITVESFIKIIDPYLTKSDPLNKYEIHEILGKGATAEVFRTIDKKTNKQMAVKKMKMASLQRRDLVISEFILMFKMNHDNIVKCHEAFIVKDSLWLVLDYLDGGTLDIVSYYTKLQEFQISFITKLILKGIDYLHSNNIIHRDLKGQNILLGLDGRVKITDFGFCAKLNYEGELKNSCLGTLFWMAPEVLKYERYSKKVDIWSLGIILVEMFDGSPLYSEEHFRENIEKLIKITKNPKAREINNYSIESNIFLNNCLQYEPYKRYSAQQLLNEKFITKLYNRKYEIKDNILFARQKKNEMEKLKK